MDNIADIAELYFQDGASEESDQNEPSEMPMNDFTFDVTSMFNETEVSFNEPKIESCENDFTFDVSTIFAPDSAEDVKAESDEPVVPNKEDHDVHDDDPKSLDQDILYHEDAITVDHSEEIDADEDRDVTPEKKQTKTFLKQLRTLNFNHQNKHAIAALSHLCHMHCEPYIASAAVNERFQCMSDRPIVRELNEEEICQFYNTTKSSNRSKTELDCRTKCKRTRSRTSRLGLDQTECYKTDPSNDLTRVLQNEVILTAEDHDNLSSKQIEDITSRAITMVENIFGEFYTSSRYIKRRKTYGVPLNRKIHGVRAKIVCNSLFVNKQTKRDFKGELLHRMPVWGPTSVKQSCYKKEFAMNTQVDILSKANPQCNRRRYYSKNKLVKDMR